MYICQASNAFGLDEMSMHLIVQEVPEQPKNLRINAQQSRSLQLTWTQPFAGNSPIEEYHIQYKLIAGIIDVPKYVQTFPITKKKHGSYIYV